MSPDRPSNAPHTSLSSEVRPTGLTLEAGIPICQTDLPLDWYQEEFRPYAEEYLALPDRTPETVLPWLDRYVLPAMEHFGDELLLLLLERRGLPRQSLRLNGRHALRELSVLLF